MNIFHLIYLMGTLNTAIDTGDYDDVGVEEICRHIEAGDLVSYLEVRLREPANLHLFEIRPDYERAFVRRLQELLPIFRGRVGPKLGITRHGFCFLIALIIQIVQDHALKKVGYSPCAAEEIIAVPRPVRNLRAV